MNIPLPILGALIGAVLGSLGSVLLRVVIEHRQARRRDVFTFYERLILTAEARKVRRNVDIIRDAWQAGDHSILGHFLTDKSAQSTETLCDNGITPHQNLSIFLHLWVAIHAYLRRGLLDDDLARDLMGHLWAWNDQFLIDFGAEYQRNPPSLQQDLTPPWATAIPELHEFFCRNKRLRRAHMT